MTEQTFNRRLDQLIYEVHTHPLREELLRLVDEQMKDSESETIVCS